MRTSSLGVLLCAALFATAAAAQEKGADAKHADKKNEGAPQEGQPMDPAMEAWMKYAAPGVHHQHLAVLVGKWDVAAKFMMGPEGPIQESKGKAEYKSIMGRRFIIEEYSGDMSGMPFEGMNILGYDTMKQKYTSVWFDSMGTIMIYAEGTCDANGKVATYFGEYDDPMTGGKTKKKFRNTMKIESKDKAVFEMYEAGPDGKETRVLELTMTRTS